MAQGKRKDCTPVEPWHPAEFCSVNGFLCCYDGKWGSDECVIHCPGDPEFMKDISCKGWTLNALTQAGYKVEPPVVCRTLRYDKDTRWSRAGLV